MSVSSPSPEEVWRRVFAFLDAPDLLACREVCKQWKDIAASDKLWRRLTIQRWHLAFQPRRADSADTNRRWMRKYAEHHRNKMMPIGRFSSNLHPAFAHGGSYSDGIRVWLQLGHTSSARLRRHVLRHDHSHTHTHAGDDGAATSGSGSCSCSGPMGSVGGVPVPALPPSWTHWLELHFIVQHAAAGPPIRVGGHSVQVKLKDGITVPALPVPGPPVIAHNGTALEQPSVDAVLTRMEFCVLRLWLPFPADEVSWEPEALERCEAVLFPIERPGQEDTLQWVRMQFVPEGQIWGKYRQMPGRWVLLRE